MKADAQCSDAGGRAILDRQTSGQAMSHAGFAIRTGHRNHGHVTGRMAIKRMRQHTPALGQVWQGLDLGLPSRDCQQPLLESRLLCRIDDEATKSMVMGHL